jgi:RimJ/RimL family protein N-acetyltransferase
MAPTPPLHLIPATPPLIDAELQGAQRLAKQLEVVLPPDWPPEHHDADTLRFFRGALSEAGAAGWWLHYVVASDGTTSVLVASVGYKGPPLNGVVEIGYSVVPSWQRRGIATTASQALIESAWRRGAQTVLAHTLPDGEASIGVLRKLGFAPAVAAEPGVLAFSLRRASSEHRQSRR